MKFSWVHLVSKIVLTAQQMLAPSKGNEQSQQLCQARCYKCCTAWCGGQAGHSPQALPAWAGIFHSPWHYIQIEEDVSERAWDCMERLNPHPWSYQWQEGLSKSFLVLLMRTVLSDVSSLWLLQSEGSLAPGCCLFLHYFCSSVWLGRCKQTMMWRQK